MRKISFIPLGIAILLNACIKEKFDASKFTGSTSFAPGIAVPIGHAHMTLQKYFNDSTANKGVIIDSSGFITLVYRERVFSIPASNYFIFSDASASTDLYQPAPSPAKRRKAGGGTTISDTLFFQIIPQSTGIQIDSMNLKAGILTLQINNTGSLQGSYSITFPGILKNGKEVQIPNNNFQTAPAIITIDLTNDIIILENHNGQNNNLRAEFVLNPSTDLLNPGDQLLGLDINIHNIQYSVFYGYVGTSSIPISAGSFPMNFYQQLLGGNFYFSNPRMRLSFTNSIGVPIEIYFSNIFANISRNGPTMPISGVPGGSEPLVINYPPIPFATAHNEIVLDSTNSNIRSLLTAIPTQITFSVVDTINPAGSMLQQDFVTDSSKLEADLQIELPLQGQTDSLLLLEDTLNFEFASFIYKNPQEVNIIYFQLNVTNDFPIEIIPQLYFTDDHFHPLDSLITDKSQVPIQAAGVNATGKVNKASSTSITIKFPRSRIQNIENATHIITHGEFRTRAANVKFYNTYYLDFSLGVIVQLQVNTGL
jgi:hypothetical protein